MSDDNSVWQEKLQKGINSLMSFAPEAPTSRDKGPPGETFTEKLVRKVSKEPLVPIGGLITVGFLTKGLNAFHKGNALQAQKLMRGRVLAQFGTVAIMVVGAYNGFKPGGDKPKDYEEKMERQHTADGNAKA
jgi:hypothetical protein